MKYQIRIDLSILFGAMLALEKVEVHILNFNLFDVEGYSCSPGC